MEGTELKRVVITGLGSITPIGTGKEDYWDSLVQGKSGVSHITNFDTEGYTSTIGAEVVDFHPEEYMDKKEAKRMDKFAQFAVAATKLAIEDSKIELENIDKKRVGVILGSGVGGIGTLESEHTKLIEKGPRRVSPFFIPMIDRKSVV